MMSDKELRSALRGLLSIVAVGTFAVPALAQQAPPAPAAQPVEEVVITGTRIRGISNAENPSPISVMSSEDIQLSKAANVEDVLNKMMGVGTAITLASNNGGGGTSSVALRDLGQSRTLVLLDGQRLIPVFGVTTALADLNALPVSMIERIEVLRDGASSIYGADAIGGVVNIITKKHAEGVMLNTNFGAGTDSGGGANSRGASAAVGINGEKGNLLVAIGWDRLDPLQQAQRTWSVDPHLNDPNVEGGSVFRSQLNVLQSQSGSNIWINGVQRSRHDPTVAGLVPNTTFLTGVGTLKLNAGAPGWNYLTQGLDRKQISLTGHYDLAPNVRLVADGFFSDRSSAGSLRPEPLLGTGISTTVFGGFYVPDYAPGNTTATTFPALLTPDQFGPRRYSDDSQTSRARAGLEGDFGSNNDYHWELGFVDQHNTTRNVTDNEGNFNHLAQISGQINCVDVPGGCRTATAAEQASSQAAVTAGIQQALVTSVPKVMPNFFRGPNMFTAAQVKYLTWSNTDVNTSTERYAYADINGKLFDLPGGPLRAALGVEHRNEAAGDTPDILVQEGWGPNQSQPTHGGYNAKSVYVEFNVPVIKDVPFAKSLVLSPSGRFDRYNTFGDAKTWKLGMDWQPHETIRFRGSYATGFRAPSVSELFAGQGISDISAAGDPCDTRTPAQANGNSNSGQGLRSAGSTCSLAVAGGGTVTNYNSPNNVVANNQQQVLEGGNPGLHPEKSYQYGVGFVLTPPFTPGLSLAVDYYNIRIDNTVLTGGVVVALGSPNPVLLGCYGPQQNLAYCALIHRSAVDHGIIQVDSVNDNFGQARVTGTEFELAYDTSRAGWHLPFPGALRFNLQAELQYKNTQSNADGSISSYVGSFQYSSENLNPRWKGLATVEYSVGPFTAHWDTRYIEAMSDFDLNFPKGTAGDTIGNTYYSNLSGSYALREMGPFKSAQLVLGINNIFDKAPPFLGLDAICKCNSLAGPFDFIGRFVYGRIAMQF
jgi:iron complex outermembrane receptor protein